MPRKRIGKAKILGCADGGVRICYREYIGDVNVTQTSFDNLMQWKLNPGLASEFPWLSGIAHQFQEYKWNKLAFSFISRSATAVNSTNLALGSLMIATDYNLYNPPFAGKISVLETSGCISSPPHVNFHHTVNVHPATTVVDRLYIRDGTPPSGGDLRLYDLGVTQLCCQGFQAACTVGEIWVSYDVTFYKPKLDTQASSGLEGPGLVSCFMGNNILCNSITTFNAQGQIGAGATLSATRLVRNGTVTPSATTALVYQLPPCGEDLPVATPESPDFITWIPNASGGIFVFKELAVGKYFRIETIHTPAVGCPTNPTGGTLYRPDFMFSSSSFGPGVQTWAQLPASGSDAVGTIVGIDTDASPGLVALGTYPPVNWTAPTLLSATAPPHITALYVKCVASGYLNDATYGTGYFTPTNLGVDTSQWRATTMNNGDVANWKITVREVPGPGVPQGLYSSLTDTANYIKFSAMY